MERLIYQELVNWKANPKRKPLVLNGARQGISMKSRKEQDWLLNLPLYDCKYDL